MFSGLGEDVLKRQRIYIELAHRNFMAKVSEVLGEEGCAKFFAHLPNLQNGQTYPAYIFPKREACLMAMSYSYELQAKVFDHMTALESKPAALDLSDPETLRTALLTYAERVISLTAMVAEQAPAVEFVDRYVAATDSKGFREVCKLLKPNPRSPRLHS